MRFSGSFLGFGGGGGGGREKVTKGRGGGGGGGVWGIGGAAVAAEGAGGAQTDTPEEEAREEEEEEADPHTVRGFHATVAAASAPWFRLKRWKRSASCCLALSASSLSIAFRLASASFPTSRNGSETGTIDFTHRARAEGVRPARRHKNLM